MCVIGPESLMDCPYIHLSSTSGGVAILFSKDFIPCSYQVEEIIKGRLLKIRAQFENSFFVFISVYVPNRAVERMCFLDTLSNVLVNCSTEDVLILGVYAETF